MGDKNSNSQLLEVTIAAPAREPYGHAKILDDVVWELDNSGLPFEIVCYRPQPPSYRKHYAKRIVQIQLKRSTPELQDDIYLRRTVTSFVERLDKYLGEDVFVSYKMVLPTAVVQEPQHTT